MSKLKIVTGADNEILRAVSEPVKKFDASLKKLVRDMKDTMIAANGLGIAAPQVGKNLRVFLAIMNYKTSKQVTITAVNPQILEASDEMELDEEGCLSLPKKYGKVARHKSLSVKFFTEEGLPMLMKLEGMNARVFQHETDHLNGVLFIDIEEK